LSFQLKASAQIAVMGWKSPGNIPDDDTNALAHLID
jgi:hypothetical protein